MILIAMAAWIIRYMLFAYGNNELLVWMFYLGIIIIVLVDYFLSQYRNNLENNDDFGKGLKGLDDMCLKSNVIWLIPIKNFKDNLGLNSIMLAGIILYLKKDEDILQGINKLDYVLKVSIFQIYKDKQKQSLKEESYRSSAREWKPRNSSGASLQSNEIRTTYNYTENRESE